MFKNWLLNEESILIPINRLYGWRPKMDEVFQDIQNKQFSFNTGKPVTVSRLDNPRGAFYIIDGYHRVVEAAMKGETRVQAAIDQYIPRIERTGGAFKDQVADKAPIMELIQRLI